MQQIKDLKQGYPLYVVWEDSAAEHGWQYESPRLLFGSIKSAGLMLQNSQKQLVLTMALNDESSRHCALAIPWSCIQKVIQYEDI